MSLLRKYLEGWTFRSNTPTFEPGEEIDAFVTGREDGTAIARIGDTKLRLPDGPDGILDTRVRLRIEEFDPNRHTGRATVLERLDEGAF